MKLSLVIMEMTESFILFQQPKLNGQMSKLKK